VKRPGLRAKLTLIYVALFSIVLTGLCVLFYQTLRQRLVHNLEQELEQTAAALHGYIQIRGGKPQLVYDVNDPQESFFIRAATRYFRIYDGTTGAVLEQSPALVATGRALSLQVVQRLIERPEPTATETPQGRLLFDNSVVRNSRRQPFLIRVGTSLAPVDSAVDELVRVLALVVPAGVLFSALAGWWLAGRALAPVAAITRAALEINISQLDRRLPLGGAGDEIDRLAETFNLVFARLQAAVEQMRQFTASISHELRTPLTALRGEAEVALLQGKDLEDFRRLLASQLEEFDKLTRLINDLLTLARAEAGEIRLEQRSVDLGRLAGAVAEQIEPVASWKKIALAARVEGEVRVAGDSRWLERVVVNLLDNAIKFTPEGGRVDLRVAANGAEALLEVRDTGAGVSPEALPHIFDRFYRADPSRSKEVDGAGLGLSLVRWIVEAHHGGIEVTSEPGKGSLFTVHLPLAQ